MRHRAIAWVATLAVLVTGCASVAPPASRFPTADAALGRMKDTYACVNGIQGTAKIDHFSRQGRIRGDVYILAVNPDRVRFDIVSPFGANLFTLTSNGTLFQMLDVGEKQLLHGPASACNLARLTQVPIPGHALVSLLRGEAPVLVHEPRSASIAWDGDGFYRVLIESTRDATEEIHLEPRPDDWRLPWSQQRLRVRQVRVAQRGVNLYHAELSHHEVIHTAPPRVDPEGIDDPIPPSGGVCDAEVPRSIRMRVPNTEDDVIFQYKEAKWNPPLISGAFTQPVPGGVIRRYVDCQD
ncbi:MULTISPECIES: LolA family protein [Sorangium]|uniref:LolA family protein n=1 Tax=Sorangium TaxID=39643 RepID=UPI003D9C4002